MLSLLVAFLLLAGCISPKEEPIIIQPPDVIQKNVSEAYRDNDPVYGLTLIEGAKSRYPSEEWDGQWQQGISLVTDAFNESMENGDFDAALRAYRSLHALGETSAISDTDEAGLLKQLILSYAFDTNPVLGLTLLEANFSSLHFSHDELEKLREIAVAENHTSSLAILQKALGGSAPEQTALSPEKARTLLKGMATIWVDRGIKIDQGVGLPDRVIGSGFFIDKRGYMLTNHHVIASEVDPEYEGYSRVYVRLPDSPKEKLPAKVIGWDTLLDVALLKVEYTPEYVFSIVNTQLGPGQHIYAIGSPGGLESTITSGIVSATDRRLLQLGDTTQIDVPINHGNSGGPLIDEYGNVVGIVFAGIESFEGINFAIPGKWINLIIEQLYAGREVVHPWLGVAVYERKEGLEVLYVFPDSPAQLSGIKAGDIITEIGDAHFKNIGEYQFSLLHHMSGELVNVQVTREGEKQVVLSSLGERPESPFTEAFKKDAKVNCILPLFGFDLEDAGSTLWEKRYRVTRILTGMAADETGLSVNDPLILQAIDVYPDQGVVLLKLSIRKRKAGFLESSIQLGAMIDGDYFL